MNVKKCCVKSVQIWSFFSRNTEKYGPEKTPYLDTFHAGVIFIISSFFLLTNISLNISEAYSEQKAPS